MRRSERPLLRGQLWGVEWEPHRGSEQGGTRPSLIVSTDVSNELKQVKNVVILAMSTTPLQHPAVQVAVDPSPLNGLAKPGIVKCDQILTITRDRLRGYIGQIEVRYLNQVEDILLDTLYLRKAAKRTAF